MWKVNLGFALALAVLALSGLGSYDSVEQLLADGREARAAQSVRLAELHSRVGWRGAGPTIDEVRSFLDAASNDEEVVFRRQEAIAKASADRAKLIILLASLLALIVTGLSVVFINRDVRGRQEAEVELGLAHANLEARVRERTAELARANEDLQRARAGLEVRVRERTAELGRANEELRRTTMLQRAILDSANYSIVSTDADGFIQTFNVAAQRWLGYSPREVVGRETPALFHDPAELAARQATVSREMGLPLDGGFEVLVTRARYGETEEREWTYVCKDGRRFPVLLSVTALHDEGGDVTGFLAIGSDVTERQRAEEELRRVTATAEAANRAKSEFLANMSHELRTPLNSVIGFTNILLKNKAGNLRQQDVTFLERVLDNGKHLLKLINEVLDLAKVEAGRMHVELAKVSLDDLVRSTLAGLEGHLKGKDVRLIPELPPRMALLETDPGKLKQVLINLVGNAIKFTERGSVTVRVETDPADGRPLALDVIDTGMGIPSDKLHDIFEAFHQADASTTRQYGGSGLGLTIARSLCRLMGYGIEVHSRIGAGSLFRVILGEKGEEKGEEPAPAAPARSLTMEIMLRAEEATGLSDLKGKRVLVIDDESDSRILLTQYIEECGCRVVAVDCGDQGLRLGQEFHPDLIVLDLMMPEMSGWDVLKALKAHPTLSTIPVVVVSIVAHENRGSILGAVDLLDKPVSREALHALLHRTLQSRKGRALVVDDSADARHLLSAYLADEGFETCEAVNGADALERLERFDANLVILDLVMPVMDGLSFLDALRRDSRHLRLPVVVVTAKDLTPQEAERLGADGSVVVRKGAELALGLKRVVGELLGHGADGDAHPTRR
ncbi:MAG TPA: response regulator [Gemmataceae bacterium]|nr:response regulator [Gemmataceae bacterium]